MHLKDHRNENLKRRKGYGMRNIFVIAVAVLLLIAVAAPVQAAELPRADDHTWGGDPDKGPPLDDGWLSFWAYVMNVLYFYHLDVD